MEEQFYLVWPIVMLVVLKRFDRRAVGIVALVLACASTVAMAVAYGDGAHAARAYFGTDTHAHGVLIGCVLGVVGRHVHRVPWPRVVASVGLAGIGLAVVRLDGANPVAYRGGIAGIGVLTAIVIAALIASDGHGPAAWMLQRTPLVGLGLVSYGVYLWHWPVLELATSDRVGVSGWPLTVLRLGVTLALAVGSFVLLERPILSGWPARPVAWIAAPAAVMAAVLALALVAPVVASPFAVATQRARARSVSTGGQPTFASAGPGARRVVVVGDSVAYTLFPGFVTHERASRIYFLNAAEKGCPLDVGARARQNDGEPAAPQHLGAECQWSRVWPPMIRRTRPDLVVALWGLWDLFDIEVGDVWLRVGTPAWVHHMKATINRAIDVLGADGAQVAILTTPYLLVATGRRVDALNAVFRAVAAARPRQVTVVDTHRPTDALNPRRWDSVHYTYHGADLLAGALIPEIKRRLPHRAVALANAEPVVASSPDP